ncbi:MAG: DUF3667 domain-containing protein [Holophagales bacterium]|nr:DUF3667 domain-containing protein [Holophagales bacterium]
MQSCRSCDHPFEGKFCPRCGERVVTDDDKRFRRIAAEFFSAMTFADSTFWKTLRTLLLRPGLFSRHFMDGRRKPYMRPLSVFLLANLIYFFIPMMTTFHTTLQTQVTDSSFLHSSIASRMVEAEIASRDISFEAYEETYNRKTKELSKLLLFIVVILYSLPLWLLHGARRTFYSENVVLSLELMSFMILFAIQGQGLVLLLLRALGFQFHASEAFISAVAITLLLYFLLRAEIHFYGTGRAKAWLLAALGVVCFAVTVYVYRAFLFFVTFWSV